MSEDELKSLPKVGSEIVTACGTKDNYLKITPRAFHEGKWYYFCTPACQEDFIRDPENSCLTSHITTG